MLFAHRSLPPTAEFCCLRLACFCWSATSSISHCRPASTTMLSVEQSSVNEESDTVLNWYCVWYGHVVDRLSQRVLRPEGRFSVGWIGRPRAVPTRTPAVSGHALLAYCVGGVGSEGGLSACAATGRLAGMDAERHKADATGMIVKRETRSAGSRHRTANCLGWAAHGTRQNWPGGTSPCARLVLPAPASPPTASVGCLLCCGACYPGTSPAHKLRIL